MLSEKIKTADFVNKYKKEYKKLHPIYSKVIGDKVYFNMSGFKHLIFKGGHRRQNAAIFNRLVLIPLIAPVVRNCDRKAEIRIREETIDCRRVKVTYYALEARVGQSGAKIRVVTRKIGTMGKHYFQSVMKY